MSISTQITRITNAKRAIIEAIKAKGVNIPDTLTLDDIPSYIALISTNNKPLYTNVLPISINSDGSIFNIVGYKNGYRLNSSVTEKAQAGCAYTGFIPAKKGDIIRIKNIDACTVGYGYVHYFNGSFVKSASSYSLVANNFVLDSNGVGSFTIPSECTYIRLSYGTMSENSIITINEEIPQ